MFKDRDKYVSGEFRWVWLLPGFTGEEGLFERVNKITSADTALIH